MKIIIVDGKQSDRELTQNILSTIIEDDKPVCESVKTAADGKEGYDQIRTEKPDLVIMDIKLSGMSGLSMLKKLRADQVSCHVLVLTADTDFKKAQQAIGLGVDDYLLKPVKKARLVKAVLNIREKLAKERAQEKALTQESIFMGCINGQVHPDQEFNLMTKEKYGFTLEDPGALLMVWLGSGYMQQREDVKRLLENIGSTENMGIAELTGSMENASGDPESAGKRCAVCVLPVDTWHALAVIVYSEDHSDRTGKIRAEKEDLRRAYKASEPGDKEDGRTLNSAYEALKRQAVSVLGSSVQGELACLWGEAEHMTDFPELLRRLRRIREWNLVFDRGELIEEEVIEALPLVPLKYPAELESQARQAVLASNAEEIRKCYYRLYAVFREKPHSPQEIKECLIRFNMAVLGAYKTQNEVQSELRVQDSMYGIREAMSWAEIRAAMDIFFQTMGQDTDRDLENEDLSSMIRKALQLVYKYYDQGITLEETARQLFVSEEYLSSQFKKETGAGFKETVRRLRIERIKGLLLNTGLKLNQIAELTGYADPKYMSRVFKEETGILPNEFRKSAH